MDAPSQTAAASSKRHAGRLVRQRAALPDADVLRVRAELFTPKTSSPTSNSVTAAPTASTSPANSMPRIRSLRPEQAGEEAADEVLGAAKPGVGPVDRRRVDLDEDLVVLGHRPRDLLEPQDLRRPVPVVDDRLHGSPAGGPAPFSVRTTFPVFCPVSTYRVASTTSSSG